MYDRELTTEQNVALLAATPAYLAELTTGLIPAQLLMTAEPGGWSARDVLAHLRACDDMWGRYIVTILREDRPTIRAISPRTWIKQTSYLQQEFHPSLQAFTAQRVALVALLRPLPTEAWSRSATVTGAGAPRERTVQEYAQRLANHERSHLRQIERLVGLGGARS